jgi:hypothetical protein
VIDKSERAKMRRVQLRGERVLYRLESIRSCLSPTSPVATPWEVMHEIDLQAELVIWRAPLAVAALPSLIDAAELEAQAAPFARANARG